MSNHNQFRSPFESPYSGRFAAGRSNWSPRVFPGTPYPQQRLPHWKRSPSTPSSSSPASNFTPEQSTSGWRGTSRPSYSPYTYKSARYLPHGSSSPRFHTTPGSSSSSSSRRSSYGATPRSAQSKKFDVNDYVIPAMTSNPWEKLEEEYYANKSSK
ncbi:unnamed protein product [Gongylonema pulchrum]|uniref:M-phase-specific PLK1-interacting protein n=1 Tax=Gongylonema pulchrum TaxID=637853 RepID=A0A183E9V2_9BILA|nr:unnamed protein product [Gongylonema pulchrum]